MNLHKILYFIVLPNCLLSCSSSDDPYNNVETTITVSNFSVAIDENPQNGDVIGTVQASTNNGQLSFSIQNQEPSGAISIDSPSGNIKIADASLFNFEIHPQISGVIRAFSNGVSEDFNFVINLNDVEETLICEGDVFLRTQDEVNAFGASGCTIIDGYVFIESNPETSSITDLTPLSQITEITGRITIRNNSALENLTGLENISTLGEGFQIINNQNLQSISALAGLTELVCSFCYIQENSSLNNLDGLQNITSLGGVLEIGLNENLVSISHLSNMQSTIYAALNITGNPLLSSLHGLEGMTYLVSLRIVNNDSLLNFSGLDNLSEINSTFELSGNGNLTSFDGLSNLTSINYLWAYDNYDLEDFTALSSLNLLPKATFENLPFNDLSWMNNITSAEQFTIMNCDALNSLDGLNFSEIEIGIMLKDNDGLSNIDALSTLVSIGKGIQIINCASLTNLDGLTNMVIQTPTTGLLGTKFLNNLQLTDFCGLSANTNLTMSSLEIYGNAYNPTYQDIIDGNCTP